MRILLVLFTGFAAAQSAPETHHPYSPATTSEKKVEKVALTASPGKPKLKIPVLDSSKVPNRSNSGYANRIRIAPADPAILLTKEDLAKVTVGLSRADVIAKLGDPASSMTSPEDDTLVETLSYHAKGQKVGSLRLIDGIVTAIEIY
jgi:hypothetical protein